MTSYVPPLARGPKSSSPRPRIALVTTVKNERTLLRANLLYHHFSGVALAYVFLDASTDGTADTVSDLPWVRCAPSAGVADLPAWAADTSCGRLIKENFASNHTSRQMLNTIIAMDRARHENCDWLISLDPDELVCTSLSETAKDALVEFFHGQSAAVKAIQFMPLEVIPTAADAGGPQALPFAECTLFKNRFRVQRRLFSTRRVFRKAHTFPKTIVDPIAQIVRTTDDYLGHPWGKMAARLREHLVPDSVHAFQMVQGGRPDARQMGWLLHYCNATFESFMTRFRHRQHVSAEWAQGVPVDWWECLWRAMVNEGSLSEESLLNYYRHNILVSDAERADWLRRAPESIQEVTAVQRFFRGYGLA